MPADDCRAAATLDALSADTPRYVLCRVAVYAA